MVERMKCQNAGCCFMWDGEASRICNKTCPSCGGRNIRVENKSKEED